MPLTTAQIQNAYVAFFNRPADVAGLNYWSTYAGNSADLLNTFAQSAEYKGLYANMNSTQIVNAVYQNLFGRAPEVSGLNYWVGKLDNGQLLVGNVADAINKGSQGTDATIISNKVTAATAFTNGLDTTAKIVAYAGVNSTGLTAVKNWLAAVTSDAATLTSATSTTGLTNIITTVQNNVASTGSTFTLTTGVDNVAGTAGSDTIIATVDAQGTGTFSAGDVIDGGAGTDTLSATITTAAKWAAGAVVKNVEVISVKDVTGAGDTLDVSNVTGATSFVNANSTGANAKTLTLNNIQANATLSSVNTVENLAATFKDGTLAAGGTLSLDFNAAGTKVGAVITRVNTTVGHAATAGTATDLTLALSATGANYATFTDGGNSVGTIKTVTASGTGSLDLTLGATEFNNVTTVNLAANSGGVTIDLGGNAKDVTVTGGSGNDVITFPNFTAADKVDGGAGTDTVNITLANLTAFTKAAQISNVETLGVKTIGTLAADTTINADYFGVSNITLNDAPDLNTKTLSLTNLVNGANVTFKASSATAAGTIAVDVKGAVAGSAESATLTFDKAVDLTTKAVTLNAAGLETITLATSTTAGAGAKLSTLADAQLTTLKVTGSDGITVGTINAAPITSIDASGVVKDSTGTVGTVSLSAANGTKSVTYLGGQGIDNYTASAKGDIITGGLGADTITLGAGADKLIYTAATDSTAAAKDVITGFSTTADVIQFATALKVGTASYIGAAAFTASGNTQLRVNGADLEIDWNGDTTADSVITLTGVTAATFGAANFTFA